MKANELPSDSTAPWKLLRKRVVLERVPLSDTTLWRQVRDGKFPAPVKIGKSSVGWIEREVDLWLAARVQERGARDVLDRRDRGAGPDLRLPAGSRS